MEEVEVEVMLNKETPSSKNKNTEQNFELVVQVHACDMCVGAFFLSFYLLSVGEVG